MPLIAAYASRSGYWRHLAPIVAELRRRGHEVRTWAERSAQPWGERAGTEPLPGDVTIVASWVDARRCEQPIVYVEHGAGQTYLGGERGWAGAPGLEHARLFLAPSARVADVWRRSYPQAVVETVGSAVLDQHVHSSFTSADMAEEVDEAGGDHDDARDADEGDVERGGEHEQSVRPLVAVTAHWRCSTVPETWPAIGEYLKPISEISKSYEYQMIGHGHPRDTIGARARARKWGIRFEPDPDVVLAELRSAQCAVLVADNTSLMYEAAALGIPVLALNSRHYRRDVEHGLRFWSHVPGLQVEQCAEFRAAVERALEDPPEAQALRARAAAAAYDHRDGTSAARAADAIEEQI